MGAPYPPQIKRECLKLFVEEGLTANAISARLGGKPVAQTVLNWIEETDPGGKTWIDLREAHLDAYYSAITPESLGQWIMKQIHALQSSNEGHTKNADALSKYTKALRDILDPVYQMSMTYQVLTSLATYLNQHHAEVTTPALLAALRAFKNEEHRRLIGRDPD